MERGRISCGADPETSSSLEVKEDIVRMSSNDFDLVRPLTEDVSPEAVRSLSKATARGNTKDAAFPSGGAFVASSRGLASFAAAIVSPGGIIITLED